MTVGEQRRGEGGREGDGTDGKGQLVHLVCREWMYRESSVSRLFPYVLTMLGAAACLLSSCGLGSVTSQ